MSSERMALIQSFQRKAEGVEKLFEARTHKGSWAMPYRLFRPAGSAKVPLVVYLHGSGGLGDDNRKQMELGNVFGTRVWALPENQKRFPCYVLAPQTDRGWAGRAGLGEGNATAVEIVHGLCREFPIDQRRIYVTGQSMGGGGTWNLITHVKGLFAAAVPVCGSETMDQAEDAARLPLWNFHGDADDTVPVAVSRARIAKIRKAGGKPIATEYAGVGHNSWQWAFTEPSLPEWLFAQRL